VHNDSMASSGSGGMFSSSIPPEVALQNAPTPKKSAAKKTSSSQRMRAIRLGTPEAHFTRAFSPFDTLTPGAKTDESGMRQVRKAVAIFHDCTGDFWDRMKLQITGKKTFEISEKPLEQQGTEEDRNYVMILGVTAKEPSEDEIDRMVSTIRETNDRYGRSVKVLCVVPRNGDLQNRLLAAGASDVISTKEYDLQWAMVISERIQHLMNDFDGEDRLRQAIVCHGSDELDPREKLARSKQTMDDFAGETVRKGDGSEEDIRKYPHHMRVTGHEDARNAAMSLLRGFLGDRILIPGCGEGHPTRVMVRNILIPEVLGGQRSQTFIIGIDMLEKMVRWSDEGFDTLRRQNHRDFKRRKCDQAVVPNVIDLHHVQKDLFQVGKDDIAGIRMGKPKIPFGVADTLILEYIAQWTPDKMALVDWAESITAPEATILLVEEYPLKVTPSIFVTGNDAQNIAHNTWPLREGVEEYYALWESKGFKRGIKEPTKHRIDPAHIPDEEAHHVYGMVMIKKPASRIFIPGNTGGMSSETAAPRERMGEVSGTGGGSGTVAFAKSDSGNE